MNKKQIKIIDCFTQLIVYSLEFKENSQNEIYTIEKLVNDFNILIDKARDDFDLKDVEFYDALFPVVAWIDEIVLGSKNKDKKLWRKQLLQKRFFNTSNAGYEFFEKLGVLDDSKYDLRLLYLYCMFLGFKGRYYRDEDIKEIEKIFEKQKALVHDDFLSDFPKFAFKKAYAQNQLPGRKKFKISYSGLWILIGLSIGVGVVLFMISQSYLNTLTESFNVF